LSRNGDDTLRIAANSLAADSLSAAATVFQPDAPAHDVSGPLDAGDADTNVLDAAALSFQPGASEHAAAVATAGSDSHPDRMPMLPNVHDFDPDLAMPALEEDSVSDELAALENPSDSGSDDDEGGQQLSFLDTPSWRKAETGCSLPPPVARAKAQPPSPPSIRIAPGTPVVPSRFFAGQAPGYVYTTREGVSGYYKDLQPPTLTRQVIHLDILVPHLLTAAPVEPPEPNEHRRDPAGRRCRRGRGAPASEEVAAKIPAIATGLTTWEDLDWRKAGLWALDTCNPSSMTSAEKFVLPRSSADFLSLQETKRLGAAGSEGVARSAAAAGWNCSATPALRCDSDFASGGVAVAARSGIGVRAPDHIGVSSAVQHRIHVAKVSALLKGGFYSLSVYLQDGVGLSELNLSLLQEVACVAKSLNGPWVLAGDFNMEPATLAASGFLQLAGGHIVAPKHATCHNSVYDYFVVSDSFLPCVRGIARVDNSGLHPHFPVRLFLAGDGRRHLQRCLARPSVVPGVLPFGPLPDPTLFKVVRPAAASEDELNRAAEAWRGLARREWASLLSEDADDRLPHFVWRPIAGRPAPSHLGSTPVSEYWREFAARITEAAALLERKRHGGTALIVTHFAKLRGRIQMVKFTPAEHAHAFGALEAAIACANGHDTVALRRAAAAARKTAKPLEDAVARQRSVRWKNSLVNASAACPDGPQQPSRKAYQWIRSASGWQKSPMGSEALNEQVPDEDDETPGHTIVDVDRGSRIWAPLADRELVPLSSQADVDREGEGWADLWLEGGAYDAICRPDVADALDPLWPDALRRSAMSFPVGTGKGADNVAPRAFARLSDDALRALAAILRCAELVGGWPCLFLLVLIVLLPKADGGRRPIGLFVATVRIWARARADVARRWEALNARRTIYGGAGMGAQRAAWLSGFRAETSAQSKLAFAQSLLDLVKAFEKVKHAILVDAAVRHGYSLWLLRMSLASYRAPRAIGVNGVYTRTITACRGITAGSTFATTELRVLLLTMVDETYKLWATVDLSLYVDDATVSATGDYLSAAVDVAGATDHIVRHCEAALELEISVKKSVAAAGTMGLAKLVARTSRTGKLTPTRATKLLGAPSGGGRKRYVKPSVARLATLKGRVLKIHQLRKGSKVNIKQMVRASATPAVTYGVEVMGMSDGHLDAARRVVAKAVSPAAGGKSHHASLYAVDSSGSSVDPAADAHVLPLKFWAMAHWQRWTATSELHTAFIRGVHRLQLAKRSCWDLVTGPVTALIASCWRLGWRFLSSTQFLTDEGHFVDINQDPPAAVARMARRSVHRWQLLQLAHELPMLVPDIMDVGSDGAGADAGGPCGCLPGPFEPPPLWALSPRRVRLPPSVQDFAATVGRALVGKRPPRKLVPQYSFAHRPYLLSAMCNGQWTQDRIAKAARSEVDVNCQLCKREPGTLIHRLACPAVVPAEGWPPLPESADELLRSLEPARRHLLLTRGLFVARVPPKVIPKDGWFRWLSPIPAAYDGSGTWYVDGSRIDGPDLHTARCGYAAVLVSSSGDLLAHGHGVPPEWIVTAAAAECWAYLAVLRACPEIPDVVTDCQSVRTTLAAGAQAACAASRPLARIWGMIFTALDGDSGHDAHGKLVWMPSHTTAATASSHKRSDGRPVGGTDWRANRLADALAKLAALSGRAPAELRSFLTAAKQVVEHSVAVLGVATYTANNFKESHWTAAGKLVQTTCRDTAPPELRKGTWGPRPAQPRLTSAAAATADASDAAEQQLAQQRLHLLAAKTRAAEQRKAAETQAELRFKAAWLADLHARDRQPAAGPSAAERLEALRQRLRQRAAARL